MEKNFMSERRLHAALKMAGYEEGKVFYFHTDIGLVVYGKVVSIDDGLLCIENPLDKQHSSILVSTIVAVSPPGKPQMAEHDHQLVMGEIVKAH